MSSACAAVADPSIPTAIFWTIWRRYPLALVPRRLIERASVGLEGAPLHPLRSTRDRVRIDPRGGRRSRDADAARADARDAGSRRADGVRRARGARRAELERAGD